MNSHEGKWYAEIEELKARIQKLVAHAETVSGELRHEYQQQLTKLQAMLNRFEQAQKEGRSGDESLDGMYSDIQIALERSMSRYGSPD